MTTAEFAAALSRLVADAEDAGLAEIEAMADAMRLRVEE